MAKHKQTVQQTSEANRFGEYYQRGLWRCPASPTGAHHWLIDAKGLGQCKYCGEKRQFAGSAVSDYRGAGDIEWKQNPLSEECLTRSSSRLSLELES